MRCARAASASIPTRFNAAMDKQREKARASWSGSGDAATEAVWFALAREGRRDGIPRLRDRDRRRRGHGAGARRQETADALKKGETGAVVLNQTPFYGEIRRPGRRYRRHDGRGRALPRHRHAEEGGRPVRPYRRGGRGHAESRRRPCSSMSIMRAAPRSAPTIPRRICCTRRCARCSAITSRRRARWSRPTGCASTSRIPSR